MATKRVRDKGAWIALVIASCALIGAFVAVSRSPVRNDEKVADAESEEASAEPLPLRDGYVMIGGVQRPATDVQAKFDKKTKLLTARERPGWDYGRVQDMEM